MDEYIIIKDLVDEIGKVKSVQKVSVQIDFYNKRSWSMDITNPVNLKHKEGE